MPIPPATPYPLQERTGPYTFILKKGFVLAIGQPYLAGVKAADGTIYTFLLVGGQDGLNKGIPGQTCNGEPTFQAPGGCQVYDTLNQYLWISNGWTSGAPADGLDSPIEGMITASNFIGWSAFCPCITSGIGYASGYTYYGHGTGGGGGGLVVNPCCPGGVSQSLFLSISGACDPCLDGNFQLNWNPIDEWWQSKTEPSQCNGVPVTYLLKCVDGGFSFFISLQEHLQFGAGSGARWANGAFSCDPSFSLIFSGDPSGGNLTPIGGGCTTSNSLTATIDD